MWWKWSVVRPIAHVVTHPCTWGGDPVKEKKKGWRRCGFISNSGVHRYNTSAILAHSCKSCTNAVHPWRSAMAVNWLSLEKEFRFVIFGLPFQKRKKTNRFSVTIRSRLWGKVNRLGITVKEWTNKRGLRKWDGGDGEEGMSELLVYLIK